MQGVRNGHVAVLAADFGRMQSQINLENHRYLFVTVKLEVHIFGVADQKVARIGQTLLIAQE